jgi:hypothetical protein
MVEAGRLRILETSKACYRDSFNGDSMGIIKNVEDDHAAYSQNGKRITERLPPMPAD